MKKNVILLSWASTSHNKNVIIISKQHFEWVITFLLCCVFARHDGVCCTWSFLFPRKSSLTQIFLNITSGLLAKSFWSFAQRTAVSLPCVVWNINTIGKLTSGLRTSRDFSLKWDSGGCPILQLPLQFGCVGLVEHPRRKHHRRKCQLEYHRRRHDKHILPNVCKLTI